LPGLLKQHKVDGLSPAGSGILSDIGFHHDVPPGSLRDSLWECINTKWTERGYESLITAIAEALNTAADTGLLMAAPVDQLLLPSSISSLESDNKQHRRRLAAPYSIDGGHAADAFTRADAPTLSSALSQPEFQTVVTTNRPLTLLELLDRTMYKVLPKMSQDKVDMHLKQLSATDLRAMVCYGGLAFGSPAHS
jgi:hypothetical protein